MRYALALVFFLSFAMPVHALVAAGNFARIVREHTPEITRCYVQSTEHAEPGVLRITLRLDIAGDGRVTAAHVERASYGLSACIEATARTWTFEGGRHEDIRLTFPFVLAS